MTAAFEMTDLWKATLGPRTDSFEPARTRLREAYRVFRDRISKLVEAINSELPGLTVHDVTHLDALWGLAGEIAGAGYDVNPAEAFVLGGGILLHDAAHTLAAYPGGLDEIRATVQWQDLIAQRFDGIEPSAGSDRAKAAIFEVLRQLHAQQARKLLSIKWNAPGTGDPMYFLPDEELRHYYSDLIGLIAASHHWSAHRTAQELSDRHVPAPGFLAPANWTVDAMKVALILRTADAAHIDDRRAPLFSFALRQPSGASLDHWNFQSKLGQPTRTNDGQLRIGSASSFSVSERRSWWLAYDTALMIDRELRNAHSLMRDEDRKSFAVTSVLGVEAPEAFAKQVQTDGWTPVDVKPRINDVPHVVELLGGAKLYGEDFSVPLREMLQNASDAVRALRAMGGLEQTEGEVVVSLDRCDEHSFWLRITDTGIGMSRHVLTHVLLDFGHSLWGSDRLREEWPGLASKHFVPAGQFGIGFFSIFMLGEEIVVSTRRHTRYGTEESDQWTLGFDNGVQSRPWLQKSMSSELLPRSGTRISLRLTETNCNKLMERWHAIQMQARVDPVANIVLLRTPMAPSQRRMLIDEASKTKPQPWIMTSENLESDESLANWSGLVAWLSPASEVTLKLRCGGRSKTVVDAGDWETLPDKDLLARLWTPNSTALVPLKDRDGKTIGRLGVAIGMPAVAATLVHRGIRCGQFGTMTGLVNAEIPSDVRRQKAAASGDRETWLNWSRAIVTQNRAIPLPQLKVLHTLCPGEDLPVVIVAGQQRSFSECEALFKDLNQIMVFFDELNQMAWDPIWIFTGTPLQFNAAGWVFPSLSGHRIEEVPATHEPVNYRNVVENLLIKAWGSFEVKESIDGVVGVVGPQPLLREAFVYSRPVAATSIS